jgi:hypothetical protein
MFDASFKKVRCFIGIDSAHNISLKRLNKVRTNLMPCFAGSIYKRAGGHWRNTCTHTRLYDIASASGTRRPGIESRQGVRFLGKHINAVV